MLHLALLATSLVLAFSAGGVYAVVLALHVVFALCVLASIALRGRVRLLALPHYYLLSRSRRCSRSATSSAACRPSGSARRARGEPRGRGRQARASTSSAPPPGSPWPRRSSRSRPVRSSSRTRPGAVPPDAARAGATRFEVLKLRTMTVDAEQLRSDGVVEAGDPRITRIGALPAAHGDRRAAAAVARAARRDEPRRAAPGAAVAPRALRRDPGAPARGATR